MLLAGALAVLAFVVAACGGDDDELGVDERVDQAARPRPNPRATEGKKGGKLTMLGASDVDYLDPGHTYYTPGYQVVYATQRTLYSLQAATTRRTPVPDLAEGEPEISDDKKTVTVKIRKGVKFAPPVNREVTSKDVKYAFERFFSVNVGGQYPAYFSEHRGRARGADQGRQADLGHRDAGRPDDRLQAQGGRRPSRVAAALVMPITAPVPEEYAKKFDAKNPSTYNTHVVATGPYMVKNDAEGNAVGYKAGQEHRPRPQPELGQGDGLPSRLPGRDRDDDERRRTRRSSAASRCSAARTMALDANPPATHLKVRVTESKDQFEQVPAGGYRYFPLNTTIKPFDNVNVRKAILAGFDRNAARLARGGAFTATSPTHFLPPGIPGFEEAGGDDGPRRRLPEEPEKGDMARRRRST